MGQVNFIIDSEELHRAFKVKCINRGLTMEKAMIRLIERWVNDNTGEFSELEDGEI